MHSDLCAISHGSRSVPRGHVTKHNPPRRDSNRYPRVTTIHRPVCPSLPFHVPPHRVDDREKNYSPKFDSEIGRVTRTTPEEGVSDCAAVDGTIVEWRRKRRCDWLIGAPPCWRTGVRYDVKDRSNDRRGGSLTVGVHQVIVRDGLGVAEVTGLAE